MRCGETGQIIDNAGRETETVMIFGSLRMVQNGKDMTADCYSEKEIRRNGAPHSKILTTNIHGICLF